MLEQRGLAYRASGGDVNFSVRRFPGYGRLSGKSIDQLRAGERVAVLDGGKEDPLDFVLWKAAKPDEPADATYDAPFGPGRPGWHIECSAMSHALLGERFDIHGGGMDLQFPHHENEIAQSDGAFHLGTGRSFVRYWLHNGFVNIDNEKMSKSLGNFFTIRDVLKHYDGETVRFFMLRGALPQSPQLQRCRARRCEAGAASSLHRAGRRPRRPHRRGPSTGASPMRHGSRPRWTMT